MRGLWGLYGLAIIGLALCLSGCGVVESQEGFASPVVGSPAVIIGGAVDLPSDGTAWEVGLPDGAWIVTSNEGALAIEVIGGTCAIEGGQITAIADCNTRIDVETIGNWTVHIAPVE